MRGLMMAGGLVAMLLTVGGVGRAADDRTYDLRGPAPSKGQVFATKSVMTIKNADTTVKSEDKTQKLKMTLKMVGEEEQKVLAVEGRDVTKCQTKVIKEQLEITSQLFGKNEPFIQPGELQGEVIISERVGENKWKHSLVDTKPTDKQKRELDDRNGIENDDDLYPAEKVKVGHEWKVEAKALTKMFGNSFADIKGELNQKFVKVESVDDEECAVIESSGTVKGKMKDEDGKPTMNVEMEMKVTTWRSVKTGVEVKGKVEGKIKMAGKQKMDDVAVDITISGPLTGESTTKLK